MSEMNEQPIMLEIEQQVARLTLNRPEKLNSLNQEAHAALKLALKEIEKGVSRPADDPERVRCLWLRAEGKAFCVGQDLNERKATLDQGAPDLGESLEKRYNPLIKRLVKLNCPTLCSVNGPAAGAGVGLALAADIVIAAKSAKFIFAFSRLGLGPDAGTSWFLPRLVGAARARALMLLGGELTAEEAKSWGLIWEQVADHELESTGAELASRLAQGPTAGLNIIRRALDGSQEVGLATQLDRERDLQRMAGRSHDYREGIMGFFEKRSPRFEGH